MKEKSFFLLSLGCAKNTVDSESMASLLLQNGYKWVEKPSQASVMIVNTCGFIAPARQESIDELKKLAARKKPGQLLIAAGCLPERARQLVVENVPGVDGFLGSRSWMELMQLLDEIRREPASPRYHIPETGAADPQGISRTAMQGASAYLKIADGCRRSCAFCSIPLIKGVNVSRPVQQIIQDAVTMQQNGVKELILIAQDTTDYGSDLGMKDGLANLLEQLLPNIPEIPWVRVLYAYPGYVTDHLIEVMAENKQLLHYLDIPLQHANPGILRSMKRPADIEWVQKTVAKMRQAMPDLALRSTFIVGYPGEGETEFNELLGFLDDLQFDHVGAFPFSFEPGTASEALGDPIPQEVKLERLERFMNHQEAISLSKNQKLIGKQMEILVEGCGDGISVGRAYRDAPEIDGLVFLDQEVDPGEFVTAQINGAMTHDLSGIIKK